MVTNSSAGPVSEKEYVPLIKDKRYVAVIFQRPRPLPNQLNSCTGSEDKEKFVHKQRLGNDIPHLFKHRLAQLQAHKDGPAHGKTEYEVRVLPDSVGVVMQCGCACMRVCALGAQRQRRPSSEIEGEGAAR